MAEHAAQRGVGIGGLGEDVHPGLVEQEPEPRAHDAMVVGEDDGDPVGVGHAPSLADATRQREAPRAHRGLRQRLRVSSRSWRSFLARWELMRLLCA